MKCFPGILRHDLRNCCVSLVNVIMTIIIDIFTIAIALVEFKSCYLKGMIKFCPEHCMDVVVHKLVHVAGAIQQ